MVPWGCYQICTVSSAHVGNCQDVIECLLGNPNTSACMPCHRLPFAQRMHSDRCTQHIPDLLRQGHHAEVCHAQGCPSSRLPGVNKLAQHIKEGHVRCREDAELCTGRVPAR